MAKQIYNFEVFTHKKEQLRRIQRVRTRRLWARRIFLAGILVIILIVLYFLQNSRCYYYSYQNERDTETSSGVAYETFADGYIKYSSDGVEYQKRFGKAVWNSSVTCRHPYMVTSSSYAVLTDKSSNVLTIFDENGLVNTLQLKYPVLQAGVSDQGIIEVILEGSSSSFIQVYDSEGNIIADMKSSVDETGYPVTAAISPDGSQLAVSYFTIAGMNARTRVAIYDFSRQLQGDSVTLKGGFDYDDLMIPKLSFTRKDILAAFGEDRTFFYNVAGEPEEMRVVEFDEKIESVFEGKNYIGYILDNSEDLAEGQYRLRLFNRKGNEQLNVPVDMNYDSICMIGREIFATRDNECTILNSRGKVLFQETLDGNGIESILPAFGWRSYHVVFRDKVVKMNLRFWGKE